MAKNIVLVGLMGAGKTSVGKILSEILKKDLLDIDALIEEQEKCTIDEIFDKYGEQYFRNLEKNVISNISNSSNKIISTGGGSLQSDDNFLSLKQNGYLVYLKASPEILYNRIKNDNTRPLLKADNPINILKDLLIKREQNYLKADLIIDTEKYSVSDITEKIIRGYNENS